MHSWLEIDLDRLGHNAAALRAHAGANGAGVDLCAVIKADGYGMGAAPMAHALLDAGVRRFAVFHLEEAIRLLPAMRSDASLLVLRPVRDTPADREVTAALQTGRLHLAIHEMDQLHQLAATMARSGRVAPVHLYVDTGMTRGGLEPAALPDAVELIRREREAIRLAGVYSHLADAAGDAGFTVEQSRRFDGLVGRLHQLAGDLEPAEGWCVHFANTAGVARRAVIGGSVRCGLGLHGMAPAVDPGAGASSEPVAGESLHDTLRPICRWRARIDEVHDHPRGRSVGYERTHRLARDSRLGVVGVGYSDGLPLAASGQALVAIPAASDPSGASPEAPPDRARPRGFAPVLGLINMNEIIIDLTDHPGVGAGDVVELITDEPGLPTSLATLADRAGSSCYELLARISPRLPRRYIRGGREAGVD